MKDHKIYADKLTRLLTSDELVSFKQDTSTLVELGYECVELGDFKRAFHLFSAGMRFNGPDPDIMNGLAISLCELGKLKSSRTVLEKAVAMYPHDAITLANLAGVHWEVGSYELAIHFYHRAITVDPDIIEAHINLINLYYEQGELFMAYVTCLQFLSFHPDNLEGNELLNELLLNIGISNV